MEIKFHCILKLGPELFSQHLNRNSLGHSSLSCAISKRGYDDKWARVFMLVLVGSSLPYPKLLETKKICCCMQTRTKPLAWLCDGKVYMFSCWCIKLKNYDYKF
jgi:hypothetical protein